MKVKFKKIDPAAKMPEYKSEGAACADLYANDSVLIKPHSVGKIPLGFAVELPIGYELQIRSRSGQGARGLLPALGVGTVDEDYRGEVCYLMYNATNFNVLIEKGDRVAQCKVERVERIEFEEVDTLSDTVRGDGGFGSTNKKGLK